MCNFLSDQIVNVDKKLQYFHIHTCNGILQSDTFLTKKGQIYSVWNNLRSDCLNDYDMLDCVPKY